MTSRFTIELGDATHAVDYNQLTALLHGYGHVDGFGFELVDGTDLEFDAGEAFVDGGVVGGDAQTLTFGDEIDPAGELPRRDVIVVDGNGDLVVETGTENEQIGGSERQARMPSPFPLVELSGTPIAEVWVDKYVVELEESDVTDRRLTSELDVHTFSAVSAAFEEASVASAPADAEDVARKAEVDGVSSDLASAVDALEDGKADDPHALGGESHDVDTLANLNSKVSNATLDDEDSSRPPESHASEHHEGEDDEIDAADLAGAAGSDGQMLLTNGESAAWGEIGAAMDVNFERFETPGSHTWKKPEGVNWVRADVIGGGSSGGGGGGRIKQTIPADEVPSNVSITVGAGGTNGGGGEDSTFGNIIDESFGLGADGGAGGGDLGVSYSGAGSGEDADWGGGGSGGSSLYGGGGGGRGGSTATAGSITGDDGGDAGPHNNGGSGGGSGGEDGEDGEDGNLLYCGSGGGGGGGNDDSESGVGGDGGDGGIPGGGGGSDGEGEGNDGEDGDGGRGEVRVWAW